MKNLFFLIIISLVACREFDPKPPEIFSSTNPDLYTPPVTSVEEVESITLKDANNRELSYLYTIIVDTGSNEELLRNKMYRLHEKFKIPYLKVLQDGKTTIQSEDYVFETGLTPLKLFNDTCFLDNECVTWKNFWANYRESKQIFLHNLSLYDFSLLNNSPKSQKTFALSGGIYHSKKDADSALRFFKKVESQAYLFTQRGYFFVCNERVCK